MQQDPAQLQSLSIGQWMNDNPVQAMLLSMASALKSPQEPATWNNLAALYNMIGLEQQAVPILRYWLERMPDNAMLLNNMGQAYLGMGDIDKATNYLQQCLAVDQLNPEANHSMGMIAAFSNQVDKAMEYFSRELQVAYRRSTLAQIKRMGRSVNLLQLRKQRTGIPHRNLFAEIGLSKFRVPPLPKAASETAAWKGEKAGLMKNLHAELIFWTNAGNVTVAQLKAEGQRPRSLYADLAEVLIREHGNEYIPRLGLVRGDDDVAALTEMANQYYAHLAAAVCPTPPQKPGQAEEVFKAYAKKCCDLHTPIINAFMSEHNGFVQQRLDAGIGNWKSYINGLVDIAQLDPSPGRKRLVYGAVAGYFNFLLSSLMTTVAEEDLPAECMVQMTSEEANEIITANHNIQFDCPSWLNIKLDMSMLKFGADCNKYTIEGGEGLMGGFEKNFKTGVSTLSVGVGVKANFGIAKADAKQMIYISFDNNDQMTDIGIKGAAGAGVGVTTEGLITESIGKVSSTLAGVEGGYSLGLNSGFRATLTGKGVMKEFIQLETKL
jgi:tetratricopeptide (TPR) repeat protein